MKRWFIISVTVILLFILQSLPAYRLSDMDIPLKLTRLQTDIACIFSIYLGVRENSLLRGALLAFVVGLFANCFAPTAMRVYSFLAPIGFVVAYISNQAFFFKKLEAHVGLVFVISVFYNILFFKLMQTSPLWHANVWNMMVPIILQAAINAFFAAIIFTFFDWIGVADESVHQKRFRS